MARKKTPFTVALGDAIRAARVERGFSQEGFAEHAKIDRSYYGAIERGEFNLSYSNVLRVARALEVPAYKLVETAEFAARPE